MGYLHEAVVENDRRATLVALRDTIATTIDKSESGRDIAALSKRLMEVMAEIESLPDESADKTPLEKEQERVRRRSRDG